VGSILRLLLKSVRKSTLLRTLLVELRIFSKKRCKTLLIVMFHTFVFIRILFLFVITRVTLILFLDRDSRRANENPCKLVVF
jgi:hypothetical protein